LPSRPSDRIYTSFSGLLFTQIALAAAIWTVLAGGLLPYVGDLKIGIAGFVCGTVLGMGPVILGSALPSFRYGVDVVDMSKAVLGTRGVAVMLTGFVVMSLGWAAIGLAMICRGIGSLPVRTGHMDAAHGEQSIVLVGLFAITLSFFLLHRGIGSIQRANNLVGPALIAFMLCSLALLLHKFGADGLLESRIPAGELLTTAPRATFGYGFEFGVTLALAWYPYAGALFRLVKSPRHIVGPTMLGGALLGICLTVIVSALAAARYGSPDPSFWFVQLTGPLIGNTVVVAVLLMSLAAICMVVYVSAIALQQYRALARMRWPLLVLGILAPLLGVVTNTSWVLAHVMTFATFGGLIFFSLAGVMVTDFWILRRGQLDVAHLFVADATGHYWYWGGVNWCALLVVAAGVAMYLAMYDPVTMHAGAVFSVFGAALPVLVASGAIYYVLARVVVLPSGRGGYRVAAERVPGSTVLKVGI
jgi:NCS1 family nucleobase:cation symporter-1